MLEKPSQGSTFISRCCYVSEPEDRSQSRITRNRVHRTVSLLLSLLIKEQNIAIDLSQNERRGAEYIKPVRRLLYDIQKHQVASLSELAEASAPERQILEGIRSAQDVDGRWRSENATWGKARPWEKRLS